MVERIFPHFARFPGPPRPSQGTGFAVLTASIEANVPKTLSASRADKCQYAPATGRFGARGGLGRKDKPATGPPECLDPGAENTTAAPPCSCCGLCPWRTGRPVAGHVGNLCLPIVGGSR